MPGQPVIAGDDLPAQIGTAAQHAARDVPVAAPADRADVVLAGMTGQRYDSAAVIAVCMDGRLDGVVTIERLLAASPDTPMAEIMDADPPVVAPGTDQEHAAQAAVQHGEPGLVVVDAEGRFQGLIPPQRLLAVLLAEHDEDMARLGGYLRSTAEARGASEESVPRRLWHRLPWLLLGLAGAIVAAGIVGAFEEQLQRQVLIAFFLPGVVYLADAVGVQTVTLAVRGLSIGVGIRRIVRRELVTGLLVGVSLALVTLPVVYLLWGDLPVAVAVSVALLAASAIATSVAMALPWALHRLGRDPAFGAGPLATVIQDLLTIIIYFVSAALILA
ncbi:magnesium transporter [Longispora albida]|uniref:magnesium transporter n=1 Tax=Longispora albida TaxID=203523 RepID=UPI0003A88F9A|nr:magnesium transporter [Longispora albida]